MRLHLLPLTLLAALTPCILAAPQIAGAPTIGTAAAGAPIPITVTWTDDGDSPGLSQFSDYTLTLYVGGNSVGSNSASVGAITATGKLTSGTASGTITPSLAAPIANGFYVQMIATAKSGGTVTAYSPRFSVPGMTGTSTAAIKSAVAALGGATAGPPGVNGVTAAAPAVPAADPAGATPAVGAAGFDVAYTLQTGPTKYAPMQGVPPTKISLKKFTPLFPPSAHTIATTWMPKPTVLTTLTESQTFSAKMSVNQASPQSHPTPNNDMQKFMARWKD